ncbi:MAG TPA: ATP-NAD kinase family protein [Candidatus Lokiarchaeia archaeon]|nr:ATP-NAD kinase family protein [Candidatus Lokiarchaeia archaeon]
MSRKEFSIGFVVNPVAGMGGSVGLKGTDGPEILSDAIQRGATPQAWRRGCEFLENLRPIVNRARFFTARGEMGEECFNQVSLPFDADKWTSGDVSSSQGTTDKDTEAFIMAAKDQVDIIAFVGGDGTARNVLEGMNCGSDRKVPVIGIPAGVKIHSAVFAVTPVHAALILLKFLAQEIGTGEGEVMDINEDAFRENRVEARLFGYLEVPQEPAFMQGSKEGSPVEASDEENKDRIADYLVEGMDAETCYIIGPGSTTKPILDKLGLQKTLLGVDAVLDGQLIGTDLYDTQLLDLVTRMHEDGKNVRLIVTVIGAQGFLFGRGNLQFTPEVIHCIGLENIIIIMTLHKFSTLPGGKMRNDTRDPALDAEMRGLYRVLVDDGEYKLVNLE